MLKIEKNKNNLKKFNPSENVEKNSCYKKSKHARSYNGQVTMDG